MVQTISTSEHYEQEFAISTDALCIFNSRANFNSEESQRNYNFIFTLVYAIAADSLPD